MINTPEVYECRRLGGHLMPKHDDVIKTLGDEGSVTQWCERGCGAMRTITVTRRGNSTRYVDPTIPPTDLTRVHVEKRTRTITDEGIELPYKSINQYIGALTREGTTFITTDTLFEILDHGTSDSFGMGGTPDVDYFSQLALEQAGLVARETRGGCYATDALEPFLRSLGLK